MKSNDILKRLKVMEKAVLKEKSNDTKTKYSTVSMLHDISRELQYRIPKPPIDVSDDRHHFKCPSCGTLFEAESDFPEDFNVCYICGQLWKEVE